MNEPSQVNMLSENESTLNGKVLEGEVDMRANHALEDYEVEQGYVLSCQSVPVTDKVVVEYE